MVKFYSHFFAAFLLSTASIAQTIQHDTTFVSVAGENAKVAYSKIMREQVYLYNGTDYQDYEPIKDEHPYFISENWITGTVHYNGDRFENVPLLYNSYKDEVIVEDFFGASMIQLISSKINYFILDGHTFVRLQGNTVLSEGFYDLLCDGHTKVYAKRLKEFLETISSSKIEHAFAEKSRYYIYKEGIYHLVRSKRSLLNVLSDQKRELNHFIHKNHIRFRADREKAIVKLTKFYNEK